MTKEKRSVNIGSSLAFVLSLTLAACVLTTPSERPMHTFLLDVGPGLLIDPPQSEPMETEQRKAVLLLSSPEAQAGFDTPMMAYMRSPYEVSYYAGSQWADTPANMLRPLLVRALDASVAWKAIVSTPTSVHADYQITTGHLALRQEFFQKPSRIHLTLRAQIMALPERRVIGTRTFEILEDAPTDDAIGGAIAANHAVTKLLAQVTKWLETYLPRQSS